MRSRPGQPKALGPQPETAAPAGGSALTKVIWVGPVARPAITGLDRGVGLARSGV
jgi:hypothetical protein